MGNGAHEQSPLPVERRLVLADVPIVALGAYHALREESDFYLALLDHSELPGRLNDIVVEFGNARH